MGEKIYTGFKDMYGEKIYTGDSLYNQYGESFIVTCQYIDDDGEIQFSEEPLLIDCVGDMSGLDRAFLRTLSKDFNRIYNDPLFFRFVN